MPSTRPLRIISTLLTTLVVGAFALSAWRDYMLSRQAAEAALSEIAHLMEEHTRAALMIGEIQILRARDIIGGRTPDQLGSPADHAALVRLSSEIPFVDSIWVFDAEANVRSSRHPLPPGGVTVSDRAYFTALRDGADGFISPLIWGKVQPIPIFSISERLRDTDGRFAGGIAVSINAAYFTDFYHTLNQEHGAIFAIYKDDGRLVMCSTLPKDESKARPPVKLLDEMAQRPEGILIAVSEKDGIERLYAYRRMEERQLVVATGIPVAQVFDRWRERTLRNAVIAAVVLAAFVAIAVTLERTLRCEVDLRARAEALLAEKNTLFQEIHHRVKNNLQIIASFLTMQAVHSRDPVISAAFDEALSRLQSMGLVHQILYEQNEATEVSMDCYLRALGDSVSLSYGAEPRGIRVEVAAIDAKLAIDQAVPLALLANEALTNALKHAFPAGQGGTIHMELARQDDKLAFSLADDGVGMAEGARHGLGMIILSALARQLGGTLDWATGPGTRLTVTFPA